LIRRLGLGADAVECPEWSAEGLGLALRGTFPLVVRLHSGARQLFPFNDQGSSFRGLDGRLSVWLEETSARRANVVVGTRSSLDDVAARIRLDQRAVHTISYPVRLPPPSPMPNSGASRVTFLGRFEPRKGPELVLRAAPQVLAVVPGARFAFVGRDATSDGAPSSAAWLRGEADKLGIAHAVEVREEFGRAAVEAELKRSTVCTVPSRWESFGYLVAEAAAIGRPVVASAIPPFQELVEDRVTGRIVSPDDTHAWADALIELLTDKQRAHAMGRAAANRIAQINGPAHIADQALAAYEHAIERWRRAERAAGG
jgi:glycosyltransferase involved in cell wall biosynthesis